MRIYNLGARIYGDLDSYSKLRPRENYERLDLEEVDSLADLSREYFISEKSRKNFQDFTSEFLGLENDIMALAKAGEQIDEAREVLVFLRDYINTGSRDLPLTDEEIEDRVNRAYRSIGYMPRRVDFQSQEAREELGGLEGDIKDLLIGALKLDPLFKKRPGGSFKLVDRRGRTIRLVLVDGEEIRGEISLELDLDRKKLLLRSPQDYHREEDLLGPRRGSRPGRVRKKPEGEKIAGPGFLSREVPGLEPGPRPREGQEDLKEAPADLLARDIYSFSLLEDYRPLGETRAIDLDDVVRLVEELDLRKRDLSKIDSSLKRLLEDFDGLENRLESMERARELIDELKESIFEEKLLLERIERAIDRKLVIELLK